MRLFVAIPLPGHIRENLSALQTDVKGIRWQPAHQLHITLKFLGETSHEQLLQLKSLLKDIDESSFNLTVEGLGTFPKKGNPRIIWVGIKKTEKLEQLQESVEDACAKAGFKKESRSFTSHITLGKVKGVITQEIRLFLSSYANWGREEFLVDHFAFYASHISSSGARHEVIKNYFLKEQ